MSREPDVVLPPTLQTRRLVLRPLTLEDCDSVFAYASHPEVARFTLWHPHQSRADSRAFIEDYALANYRHEVPDPYGIALRGEPERILGTIGCSWVSPQHRTMELGFALARQAWGFGLGTEAAWAVVCFAFSICRPQRLQARCHPANRASARVLTKLGMRREGLLRSAARKGDEVWDVELFSLLQADWRRYLAAGPDGPPGRAL